MGESVMASLDLSASVPISTSVKVFCLFVTTQFARLVGGTYTSYSEGMAEWKSLFSV